MPISIYDWKCHWADRKWIYTAVTRARQLDQVFFQETWDYKRPKDELDVRKYLWGKINGYERQDKRAGRHERGADYVTVDWLYGCFGKPCSNCGDLLMWERNGDGRLVSNLTAQRINNSIPHEMHNIIPMCVECNRALSNREP
jgi:hypothetical protein